MNFSHIERLEEATPSNDLESSLKRLEEWLVERGFKGNDPHDALRSPILRALTFKSRWLGVAWVQLLRRSPLDLRRLLCVAPGYNPKGMGLFLSGYIRRYRATGNVEDRDRIDFFANWLRENRCEGFREACWGYNFDWPNRSFFAPAGTPTIVNTVFVAQAFLDRHELLGEDADLAIACSACEFIVNRLERVVEFPGSCFAYTPLDRRKVHNANMLGASLLARVGRATGNRNLMELAREAALYTVARQKEDGSWPYGSGDSEGWIDNFHTGFVLVSLLEYIRDSEDLEFESNLECGYRYWKSAFFTSDGRPKFYANAVYPIDVHAVAQGVLTFLAFRWRDAEATTRALQLAEWGCEWMQDAAGCFHYQIGRYIRNRIPYIRWSQAWMFRALAESCLAQQKQDSLGLDAAMAGKGDDRAH